MRNFVVAICTGMLMVNGLSPARADDQAQVDELEETVEQLRQRVETLEKQQADPTEFKVYWKEGVRFNSGDGAFKMKIGGRIMSDWVWFDQDSDLEANIGNLQDGVEFRRARLYMQGDIYKNIKFKAQYDFAGGDADFKDMYLGLKGLPFGTLQVGHFKEPFSLEELTSSKYITFMERATPIEAFVPSRNVGVGISNHILEDRATYALGVFRDTDGFGEGQDDGKYNVTARLTGLPLYENKGEQLVHLGVAYSYRNPTHDGDSLVRYRSRPESHMSDRLVNTDHFQADDVSLIGVEGAAVYGPGSLQAEYITAMLDSDAGDDPDFDGFYVGASYFLTGEHRKYKTSSGHFARVKPKQNFMGEEGGIGAWEVGARYSQVDLCDGLVSGGELDTITAGLNWYLNPNTRVMLNYVYADVDQETYDGEANILQMRFQVDF